MHACDDDVLVTEDVGCSSDDSGSQPENTAKAVTRRTN